jgi:homocysteine S-methyltransferase
MTDITLLDGGMGQELLRRSGDPPTPLWSTQVMRDHPGLAQAIHADFFDAGATVATANTYAILRDRLRPAGCEADFAPLNDRALGEAEAARAAHGSGRIAGAIGPLGGSYRPDLHPAHAPAVAAYAEKVHLLAPRCDVILFETLPSLAAVRAALDSARNAGRPVWIGVTVDDADGRLLRSGERAAALSPILSDGAAAVLVNCSAPEAMPPALDALSTAGLPLGAHANAFTRITKDFLRDRPTVDALTPRRDMGPVRYADHAMRWMDHGATILGGCCETGPAHIAEIARRLRAAGHRIV